MSALSNRFFRKIVLGSAALLFGTGVTRGDVYNLKVVTDASPDYTDMASLAHSITSKWETDKDKMWALFYWNHIGRRQTSPMSLHGFAHTDPIRQFNDYGFTMCSTISGLQNSIFQYMGYPSRYYDIAVHTVSDVFYDNAWHHYDNSLSVTYTLCDGTTIAGVHDIGKTLGCAASGGKEEAGHIAIYHAVNGTGVDGYLEGGDTIRDLRHLGEHTFQPKAIKHRTYYNDAERAHRYILNLRAGEVYTRYYHRLDGQEVSKDKFKSDPAYFTPNGKKKDGSPYDPEASNPRYRIRGNGVRTYAPPASPDGLYKVEGANVITSMKITADSAGKIELSTDNGMSWATVREPGSDKVDLKLINEVNGAYEVLVKAPEAMNIKFETITQVNSKTQPKLNLGKNTIYLGAGDQTGSVVLWPDLRKDKHERLVVESSNMHADENHKGWHGVMHPEDLDKEGHIVFKIECPDDITRIVQNARMYVRVPKANVRFAHSFDGGKTWVDSFKFDNLEQPWDDIHDQITTDIPAGTKSVLFKYTLNKSQLYSIRMEANHKVPASSTTPLEVTFNWKERQEDYSQVKRSHTQLVEKLPFKYDINVGGADHPVVESLTINPKGARTETVAYGYADGKDGGGEKFVGKWVTYGKNFALGKSYTLSVPPSENDWKAGDPELKVLTDGRVGSGYSGGISYSQGPLWKKGLAPEIVVDLGETQKAAAFRVHLHGFPFQDGITGKVKDEVEVFTSLDGKEFKSASKFDFRLRWKDIPVNFMWADEEQFGAYNYVLKLQQPIEARYVKYAAKSTRFMVISEVQVLDGVEEKPFDLRIALPDEVRSQSALKN